MAVTSRSQRYRRVVTVPVESVTPFAKRIIEEQTHPITMAKGLTATLRRTMKAVQGLPDNVNRILKRVADGDLRMTVRPGGFDPLMSRAGDRQDCVRTRVCGGRWRVVLPLDGVQTLAPRRHD